MSTPVIYDDARVNYNDPATTYFGAPLGLHGWIYDQMPIFYTALVDYGFAHECTVTNTVMAPFLGLLDTVDIDFFDSAGPATTHTLRYVCNTRLKIGDTIYIDGAQYTVAHTPHRINREEMRARLILTP